MIPARFLSRSTASAAQSPMHQIGLAARPPSGVISFAVGYPDPSMFPWEELSAAVDRMLSSRGEALLQYTPTRGYGPLIECASHLLADRGVIASVENTLVLTGSQQGLDLIARTLLDPGDVVLVEVPTYPGALSAFGQREIRLVGVRQGKNGIDLSDLDRVLWQAIAQGHRVKLLYLVPNFHNPTGCLTHIETRRAVLDRAVRDDFLVVEDDPYGDLYFDPDDDLLATRPIKASDNDERIIYVTSVSKSLFPALRTAWLVAAPPLVSQLEISKQAADLCTSTLNQQLACELIQNGTLAQRLPSMRAHYCERWRALDDALRNEAADMLTWTIPRGGFFTWVHLPARADLRDLARIAMDEGVMFVPGRAFCTDGDGGDCLRLAYSLVPVDQIGAGVQRLVRAIRRTLSAVKARTTCL